MYLITVEGKEDEGAYSVTNEDGEQVLYLFEDEDDAVRFAMMLESRDGYPGMHVMEVEDDLIIKACDINGYQYSIFTPYDIIIPPEEESNDFI